MKLDIHLSRYLIKAMHLKKSRCLIILKRGSTSATEIIACGFPILVEITEKSPIDTQECHGIALFPPLD
jgi:hypothetical protein